jgi:hypothetical protein
LVLNLPGFLRFLSKIMGSVQGSVAAVRLCTAYVSVWRISVDIPCSARAEPFLISYHLSFSGPKPSDIPPTFVCFSYPESLCLVSQYTRSRQLLFKLVFIHPLRGLPFNGSVDESAKGICVSFQG